GHAPAAPRPPRHRRPRRTRHARRPSSRLPAAEPITWRYARRSPAASVLTSDKPEPRQDNGVPYSRRAEPTHGSLRRADNGLPVIRYTLPRLLADPAFRRTVAKLLGEGWLDWHLFNAIATLVSY